MNDSEKINADPVMTREASIVIRAQHVSCTFDVSSSALSRLLHGECKQFVHAVNDVSFDIRRSETLALVGESGCGKSTLARLLAGLYTPTSGTIEAFGEDLMLLKEHSVRARILRNKINMVFQDPYASLNPRWRVREIIAEPLITQKLLPNKEALEERIDSVLKLVRLTPETLSKFPHQFSGGQRQRIAIARALAQHPEFLILDEPTSALDVSVQAQVLNLMKSVQREIGLTYLFISHNLAVVHHIADRVGVMYLGQLVELGAKSDIFNTPRHPYTQMLLASIPDLSMSGKKRIPIQGEVPSPLSPPKGCAFHPRCPYTQEICRTTRPVDKLIGQTRVACHFAQTSLKLS